MCPLRVYADTSVFGGVFDEKFAASSQAFFRQVQVGRFQLVLSALVRYEIDSAPVQVRQLFEEVVTTSDVPDILEEAILLRDAYLQEGIVGRASVADALHVAHATVSQCKVIVSWNFRHIVHYEKIQQYNSVNARAGYPAIAIHTPQEVIDYGGKDS